VYDIILNEQASQLTPFLSGGLRFKWD